jgi:hypothetical protein
LIKRTLVEYIPALKDFKDLPISESASFIVVVNGDSIALCEKKNTCELNKFFDKNIRFFYTNMFLKKNRNIEVALLRKKSGFLKYT